MGTMFRRFCQDDAEGYGVLVSDTAQFGPLRQRRAVLACWRELGISVYLADTGSIINWTTPALKLSSITGALKLDQLNERNA